MYKVTIETHKPKNKQVQSQEFELRELDTPEYDQIMDEIADTLYDLELEYDDIEGDGDMIIDDLLIMISDCEEFETTLNGQRCDYIITGVCFR